MEFKDSIRRRFGNALHWYQALVALVNHEIDGWISGATAPPMNASTADVLTAEEMGAQPIAGGASTRSGGVTVEGVEDEGDGQTPWICPVSLSWPF
jgi:hypothetical protein